MDESLADSGTLYIVSTPIGNLADMTLRGIEVLKSVDYIASEDTRRTIKLLKHFGILTRQVSFYDHNKEKVAPKLIDDLKSGLEIAVVSDAGTPGISDPGFYLVRECIRNSIPVVPVPGASSVMAAIVVSGLPTDRFSFEGFLPKTKGKLKRRLVEIKDEKHTLIFFESPYRVAKTLKAMLEIFGNRKAFVGRELTKKFEQVYRDNISSLYEIFKQKTPRGEIVLVVCGKRDDID